MYVVAFIKNRVIPVLALSVGPNVIRNTVTAVAIVVSHNAFLIYFKEIEF